jgi:glucuronyl esterase-like protein
MPDTPAPASSRGGAEPGARALATAEQLPARRELPDPFEFIDGSRVKGKVDWQRRRAELAELVQHYAYGHQPPAPDQVEVVAAAGAHGQGLATAVPRTLDVKVRLRVGERRGGFSFALALPAGTGPFPVFISAGGLSLPLFLERGYAVAELNPRDVAADSAGRGGLFYTLYPETDAGALMAWAWGFSRVVDALAQLSTIRVDQVALTGHSRFGKAALVAGAFDPRIALTVPASSGLGGTGNYRFFFEAEGKNERIENITGAFPYWFTPALLGFVGHAERLPFDQHALMALVAPRALLTTVGTADHWANPRGTELTHQAAQIVYAYLGVPQNIGIQLRPGTHAMTEADFEAMLDFADTRLRSKPSRVRFDKLLFPKPAAAIPWVAPG